MIARANSSSVATPPALTNANMMFSPPGLSDTDFAKSGRQLSKLAYAPEKIPVIGSDALMACV